MSTGRSTLSVAFVLLAAASGSALADQRQATLDAMAAELGRNQSQLRLADNEAPYFISYRLVERHSVGISARFGAIYSETTEKDRRVAVDVRVGSYLFDSSPENEMATLFEDEPTDFEPTAQAPMQITSPEALQATLWLLTDVAYKGALSAYLNKRARLVNAVRENEFESFSKEAPARHVAPEQKLEVDEPRWRQLVENLSLRFRRDDKIIDGTARIAGERVVTYLVTNEGTRLIKEHVIYTAGLTAITRAEDGMLLDHAETLYSPDASGIPKEEEFKKSVDRLLAQLALLRAAPVADPYTGPAILEPEATGVLFHETVGHRLEGERQNDEKEGQTFVGRLGKKILPDFLTVRDDPGLAAFRGTPLNGAYRFDDEGVPASDALLVEKGVLKTFLMSRAPVKGVSHSNGHGRAQSTRRPVARMGSLIVEAVDYVPHAKLKEMLLERALAQGKPYGLIIRDITGGSTNTSTYGYQAFKGSPRLVYRVDAKSGEEQLVRGVEIVGTPLTVINKIRHVSDWVAVFNGYCGAESGYIPVSTVAPAALLEEIELQRTQRTNARQPLLPPPWVKHKALLPARPAQ